MFVNTGKLWHVESILELEMSNWRKKKTECSFSNSTHLEILSTSEAVGL